MFCNTCFLLSPAPHAGACLVCFRLTFNEPRDMWTFLLLRAAFVFFCLFSCWLLVFLSRARVAFPSLFCLGLYIPYVVACLGVSRTSRPQAVLIVNVASHCGYTDRDYRELQALRSTHDEVHPRRVRGSGNGNWQWSRRGGERKGKLGHGQTLHGFGGTSFGGFAVRVAGTELALVNRWVGLGGAILSVSKDESRVFLATHGFDHATALASQLFF